MTWSGQNINAGEQKVTKYESPQRIEYTLEFTDRDFHATGEIKLEQLEKGVRVTWRNFGDVGNSFFARLMIGGLDASIGESFQKGLERLKKLAEAGNTTNQSDK